MKNYHTFTRLGEINVVNVYTIEIDSQIYVIVIKIPTNHEINIEPQKSPITKELLSNSDKAVGTFQNI